MKIKKYNLEFCNRIPHELKEGILYICIDCNVIIHKCACGCGERTVTPIDKENGWIMKYDGKTITLRPSIGNFSMDCKSHYYITENKVEWLENQNNKFITKKVNKWNWLKEFLSFKN